MEGGGADAKAGVEGWGWWGTAVQTDGVGDFKVKGKQIYIHACILSQYIDTNVYYMLK